MVEDCIRTINPFVPVWRALRSRIDMKYILDHDAWSLDKVMDMGNGYWCNDAGHNVITCHVIQGSVQCFNMAGQQVYCSKVPLGEDPYGPWLRSAAKKQIVKGQLHLVKPN